MTPEEALARICDSYGDQPALIEECRRIVQEGELETTTLVAMVSLASDRLNRSEYASAAAWSHQRFLSD